MRRRSTGRTTPDEGEKDRTTEEESTQLEDKSKSKPFEAKSKSKPSEDKTKSKQIEARGESKQLEAKSKSKPSEDKTKSKPFEDKTKRKPSVDKTKSKQIEARGESKQLEDESKGKPRTRKVENLPSKKGPYTQSGDDLLRQVLRKMDDDKIDRAKDREEREKDRSEREKDRQQRKQEIEELKNMRSFILKAIGKDLECPLCISNKAKLDAALNNIKELKAIKAELEAKGEHTFDELTKYKKLAEQYGHSLRVLRGKIAQDRQQEEK